MRYIEVIDPSDGDVLVDIAAIDAVEWGSGGSAKIHLRGGQTIRTIHHFAEIKEAIRRAVQAEVLPAFVDIEEIEFEGVLSDIADAALGAAEPAGEA